MKVSRGIEVSVEVGIEEAIEQKESDSEQKLDRSNRCRGAIEDVGAFSIDPPGIKEVSRFRLRKMLEKLDR